MNAAREQVIVLTEFGFPNPVAHCVTGRLGNFKLDRPRGFLLHHGGAGRHAIAMANVAHPHFYQVTSPKLAIQPRVEHGELTNSVLKLKTNPNCPNFFQFERGLLPDDHVLVPGSVLCLIGSFSHDGLFFD